MYVSIRDALLFGNQFSTPVEGLRHLGIDAVELALARDFEVSALDSHDTVPLMTDRDATEYGERLQGLGVRACAMLTACDFSCGDREGNIGWVARAIELADLMGMDAVRIDSAMARERELDFETRVRLFAECLGEALRRTKGSRVALGVENHGYQGNDLDFLLGVFERVGSDRLGSTLDTGNFYWRGYPLGEVYRIIEALAPHARHTHLKNIAYPEELREQTREEGWEYGRCASPLDEGDIDHARVVRTLADHGYDGDLCIEDESLHRFQPGEERLAVLRRDVAYVKKLVASLG